MPVSPPAPLRRSRLPCGGHCDFLPPRRCLTLLRCAVLASPAAAITSPAAAIGAAGCDYSLKDATLASPVKVANEETALAVVFNAE
ncbi:hypothetical protein Zmor_017476 [Zophobas morio]|uniref:Uncharacterized protein n=1 Tax=Zophobas morio TaxID=2755281 RepID=A0AA38ICM4_9CUCU|nr:hypothetical protein Zmor_017476 [Zophobas morio]